MARVLVLVGLFAVSQLSACKGCGRNAHDVVAPGADAIERTIEVPPPVDEKDAEAILIETEGDFTLAGSLYRPRDPAAPLVVLLHQIGSSRAEWKGVRERLAAAGDMAFVAIDLRGHGASTKRASVEVPLAAFTSADFAVMPSDTARVLDWVRQKSRLTPRAIAIVGSSIGATMAIMQAARDRDVRAVVAISPGRDYKGLDIVESLETLGTRPTFAVASKGDSFSAEAVALIGRLNDNSRTVVVEGSVHGVKLFHDNPRLLPEIAGWLRAYLAAGASP